MKILMVSIFSSHFFNWTEQLKDSGHEIYWLDVFDSNTKVKKIDFVNQIVGWRYRSDFSGRHFFKDKIPRLNTFLNKVNERNLADVFNEKLDEIRPDVVHSFVMYLSCTPIFQVMRKYPHIKWIYSSWGSDLYFYRNKKTYLKEMKMVLPYIDFMFSDCNRDFGIACQFGFKGEFLGAFPGRGGYETENLKKFIKPFHGKKVILIKGYQGTHGRCIEVLKAISKLRDLLRSYKMIIFAAENDVFDFAKKNFEDWENFVIYDRIDHSRVMKFMGDSFLYIGNSLSDGMPNTLLEAIIMGAFPIQSNPGGATAEIIENGKNGLLINNPEDTDEIAALIRFAIENRVKVETGISHNFIHVKPHLERGIVKAQVLEKYEIVEQTLNRK